MAKLAARDQKNQAKIQITQSLVEIQMADSEGFMKATVKWVDGAMFVAESGSGHALVMDGPPDHGGRNLGPRPMEMLLLGVGGCSSFDGEIGRAAWRQRMWRSVNVLV